MCRGMKSRSQYLQHRLKHQCALFVLGVYTLLHRVMLQFVEHYATLSPNGMLESLYSHS